MRGGRGAAPVTRVAALLCIAVGCALITAVTTPVVRRLAARLGLVDHPAAGAYKTHSAPVPYGGGVAIYCGAASGIMALIGLALFENPTIPSRVFSGLFPELGVVQFGQTLALFVGASAVFLVGLVDDWIGLSPPVRLVVQVAAASLLAWGVPGFDLPLAPSVPLLAPLATTLWIVALANAFNFLDNMDGLVAGMAVILFASTAAIALWTSHLGGLVLSLALAGAAAGFLLYNFPRASIFMGDAGGLFLGFAAAGVTALLSHHLAQANSGFAIWPYPLAPALAVSVAAYDQVTVVAWRLWRRRPPWMGDTNHVSHRLVRLGLSRRHSVLVLHGLVACSGALALGVLALSPLAAWRLVAGGAAVVVLLGSLDYAAARRSG